jgi:Protein of unknown function (DUF1579)
MKILPLLIVVVALPAFAQEPTTSPGTASMPADSPKATTSSAVATSPIAAPQPSDAEMMKQMVELAKLNENHKLLADLAGDWRYTVKMWTAPNTPAMESKGTASRKPMMNGRYFTLDVTGKMKMPGADGKMQDFTFKGHGMEGYDNVKKKFVGTWMDNMGTGIMMSEGDYDPTSKTFTYTGEMEMMPGMKEKMREVVKIADKNHHTFEFYEDRGTGETKTMEINYTRQK